MSVSERVYRRFYPDLRRSGTLFFYQRLRQVLGPGKRILNLGAGSGDEPGSEVFSVRDLRGGGWIVCGCDPDPAVLGNRQLDEAKLMAPGGAIPYEDASFDLVFSDYVLEHVADPETFVAEVHRVLKPGGTFQFRTPNLYHYVSLAARLLPNRMHALTTNRARNLTQGAREPYPTFHRMNTRRALRRLSARAGFLNTDLVMIEAEPSYLVFNTATFLAGVAYEHLVNRYPVLEGIKANIIGRIVK